MFRNACLALLTFAAALPSVARADLIAMDMDPNQQITGALWQTTVGWKFTTNADITVSKLGFWDSGADGFAFAHDVAVFDSQRNILVSGTVRAGTAEPVEGRIGPRGAFRYVTVPETILTAGETYVIAGSNPVSGVGLGDLLGFSFGAALFVTDPAISFVEGRRGSGTGPGLFFPDAVAPDPSTSGRGIFGPNFQFSVIPEPGSLTLLGLGALGLVGYHYRRRASGA